jgi:diadenylate cyclase
MIWLTLSPWVIFTNIFSAIIDIFVITFIFYSLYRICAQTKAVQILQGLFVFVVLYIIARILKLETFSWILDRLANAAVVALFVLFQPELRRIFTKIGQSEWASKIIKKDPKDLEQILTAVENFHLLSTGALIVFERKVGLKNYMEDGEEINSKISARLLMTIFYDKTALHDGAVIIRNDQIAAAACYLPISNNNTIDPRFGTRHRAALGLAEETDAVIVVVSEETGKISLAVDGRLYSNYDKEGLRKELSKFLGYESEEQEDFADENE